MSSSCPTTSAQPLALAGSLSVLAVPIFVDGVWWGFIGFEDCEHHRDWSPAETDALRAAAGIVAAAIKRELVERDLRRRDAILEAVSRGAGWLVAAPSWRDAAGPLPGALGARPRNEPVVPLRERPRDDGRRVASQRFEWVAHGTTPELDNPVMQDMCFEDVGLARFARVARATRCSRGRSAICRPAEREFFEEQAIKSLFHRARLRQRLLVGLHRLRRLHDGAQLEPGVVDALRTAASLIATAIRA